MEKDKDSICKRQCKPIEIPTDIELQALNRMRLIKQRAKRIKEVLSRLSSSQKNERDELEKELKQLKLEWKEWEKKREDARRERMILLGHEKP